MNVVMEASRTAPAPRNRRRAALVVALLAGVAACGSGDDSASTTVAPSAPGTTAPDAIETGTTVPATTAPATTVPVTVPDTLPATTAAVATPPPTEPVPVTTEPLALQELILTGDGLGSAVFGADPDGVIEYVTSILGGNTGDTGWVDPFSFAACEGSEARKVDWGTLSLIFTDQSPFASGRRHFIAYEYGRVGQIGDEPDGLHTPGGITLGSRVVDLYAEFPEAVVNPGEPDLNIPDNFYVSNVFYGLLTGPTDDDYITVLFGGYGCGE